MVMTITITVAASVIIAAIMTVTMVTVEGLVLHVTTYGNVIDNGCNNQHNSSNRTMPSVL